jgi:hypothetical protein
MSEETSLSKAIQPSPNRVIPASKEIKKNKFPKGGIGPQFVNRHMHWFETYWHQNKRYPDDATVIAEFGFSKLQVDALNSSKYWLQSLDRRGIKRPSTEPNRLSSEQVAAIAVITNFSDTRPAKARLAAMGITDEQLHGWQQDPAFQKELTARAEDTFAHVAPVAKIRLAQQIDKGNLNAIKFYFEITGQAETPETINVKRAMQTFIDVLQRHVPIETLVKVKAETDAILGVSSIGQG